jgi:hypothetical protein
MALLVDGNVAVFTALKMAITVLSVALMVVLARYRFLRLARVEVVLYGVLAGYLVLICYEIGMLRKVSEVLLF